MDGLPIHGILQKTEEFSKHMSTLKDTSADMRDGKNVAYMTESAWPAVNFDKVKESYVENLGLCEVPKSNDALMEDGKGHLVFVEFKNGYMDRQKQFAVRKKIYDSVLIFSDITSQGISSKPKIKDNILVYNESANAGNPERKKNKKDYVQPSVSFDSFAKKISSFAKEEYVCFGVKIFENYCFRSVHTYTEQEFALYLSSLPNKSSTFAPEIS